MGSGDGPPGPLRAGLILSDGFNLVAEEFQPHWPLVLGRKDIDNSPSERKLPRRLNRVRRFVADATEMFFQVVETDLIPAGQFQPQSTVEGSLAKPHQRSRQGRGDDPGPAGAELPQSNGTSLDNLGVR